MIELTTNEIFILNMIARGLTNEEIANHTNYSSHYMHSTNGPVSKLYRKFNLSNDIPPSCKRAALVAQAFRRGVL